MSPSDKDIYVDYDDVLCETAKGLAAIARDTFGWTGAFEDIASFNLRASFELDLKQEAHLMERGHHPEMLRAYEPVPGAIEGMRRIAAGGVRIHIVTGRPASCHAASAAWLKDHDIPYESLIFVDKYGRHPGNESIPLNELLRHDFHHAIEDAPTMLNVLLAETTIPIIVFRRPWNDTWEHVANVAHKVIRLTHWQDIATHILSR